MDDVRYLQRSDRFGRQPRYIGLWGINVALTDAERQMLIVANDRCHTCAWEFEMSRDEWMEATFLCSDAVREAEQRLCRRGILTVLGGGNGRGHRKRYRYNPDLAEPYLTAAKAAHRQQKAEWYSRQKGDRRSPKRQIHNRKTADVQSPKGRRPVASGDAYKEDKEKKETKPTTTMLPVEAVVQASTDPTINANYNALRKAGVVSKDKAHRLSRLPNITPAVITRLESKHEGAGKYRVQLIIGDVELYSENPNSVAFRAEQPADGSGELQPCAPIDDAEAIKLLEGES